MLDVRVKFLPDFGRGESIAGLYTPPCDAEAALIEIGTTRRSMFTQMTTLLHELGHHLDYIKRGGWSQKENEAADIFEEKGSNSPRWVKKNIWDVEENAHQYMLRIVKFLDIKMPLHSFYYDLEKTRKRLRLELNQDKINEPAWKIEKKRIRAKLRGVNATKKKYKKHRY